MCAGGVLGNDTSAGGAIMSYEYLCSVCGKSVFSSHDWRGMKVLCEDCEERSIDKIVENDIDAAIEAKHSNA